jgi:two-component system cell cycle response regulator DivK
LADADTTRVANILIIEDDPNNRLVVVKLLQLTGIQPDNIVELERDPADYFENHPDKKFDLILLDLQLPGKDGYTILQELQEKDGLNDVPVIALTANVMGQDLVQIKAAGFDGFIGKPIDGRRFPDQVRRLLAGESIWANT